MNTASLNEISFNILNSLRGGRSSHTEHLSLEQIKFAVKYYRALFIRRDFWKNSNRFRMFEQDLGTVSVDTVDSAESSSYNSGDNIIRTDDRIPTPIRLKKSEAITYIGEKDKVGEPFPLLDTVRTPWQSYNKYTNKTPFAIYRDGYIYIINDITVKNLEIRGVFEDPEAVHEFTKDNGLDLYDEDSPFPISTDMLQGITKGIIDEDLTLAIQSENDKTLDLSQGG